MTKMLVLIFSMCSSFAFADFYVNAQKGGLEDFMKRSEIGPAVETMLMGGYFEGLKVPIELTELTERERKLIARWIKIGSNGKARIEFDYDNTLYSLLNAALKRRASIAAFNDFNRAFPIFAPKFDLPSQMGVLAKTEFFRFLYPTYPLTGGRIGVEFLFSPWVAQYIFKMPHSDNGVNCYFSALASLAQRVGVFRPVGNVQIGPSYLKKYFARVSPPLKLGDVILIGGHAFNYAGTDVKTGKWIGLTKNGIRVSPFLFMRVQDILSVYGAIPEDMTFYRLVKPLSVVPLADDSGLIPSGLDHPGSQEIETPMPGFYSRNN